MLAFKDRKHAGQLLAELLTDYTDDPAVIILALPRGGVPVAFEIAKKIHAPLDLLLVRKLGAPGHEELAMGAIAWGNVVIFNQEVISAYRVSQHVTQHIIAKEKAELERRNALYRKSRPPPDVKNKKIILVDDGLATGATMRAAVTALRAMQPAKVIVAVPVADPTVYLEFKKLVDEVACVIQPSPLYAIGAWYSDFTQTTDEEVRDLLDEASKLSTNAS